MTTAMIEGFEEITESITPYERDMVIPALVNGLKKRVGARYAIRNKTICQALAARGFEKISEARIRKCINYIRINGLVPHLIANSHGYYVATSITEVDKYAESLKERATAILAMRKALIDQRNGVLFF